MVQEVDASGDGEIDFEEFVVLVRDGFGGRAEGMLSGDSAQLVGNITSFFSNLEGRSRESHTNPLPELTRFGQVEALSI